MTQTPFHGAADGGGLSLFRTNPEWTRAPSGGLVPRVFTDIHTEVAAIRSGVGLSLMSHLVLLRLTGRDMWEVLEWVCPTDLFLRHLQVKHALLLHADTGGIFADVTVGHDDDGIFLVVEQLSEGDVLDYLHGHIRARFPDADYAVRVLTATHTAIGLDGPFAWDALVGLEGPDVVGFPHGTLYHPRPDTTYLRTSQTGEFGYLLIAPHGEAAGLWGRLVGEIGVRCGLAEVGLAAVSLARLEAGFFHLDPVGASLTPTSAQLSWRLPSEPRDFVGRDALNSASDGSGGIAVVTDAALAQRSAVLLGDIPIGSIRWCYHSPTLNSWISFATLSPCFAFAGLDGFTADGIPARTVSAPFVNNLTLYVDPQRHNYATRAAIPFPGPVRPRITRASEEPED